MQKQIRSEIGMRFENHQSDSDGEKDDKTETLKEERN